MLCCGNRELPASEAVETYDAMQKDKDERTFQHPTDSQIALTTHTPLFIPGRIIHVVRNHPPGSELVRAHACIRTHTCTHTHTHTHLCERTHTHAQTHTLTHNTHTHTFV